jgi:hypothetical protein
MRILMAALGILLVCGASRAVADGACDYEGQGYLNGSEVCQAGIRYLCVDTVWHQLSTPCPLQSVLSETSCEYEGQIYASGRVTCQSGIQQRCESGKWQSLRTECGDGGSVVSTGLLEAPVRPHTCLYRDAQFHSQSIMCKDHMSFICEGGSWVSLRTPCE